MITGTHHFRDLWAVARYYRVHSGDPGAACDWYRVAREKIAAGEAAVGKPEILPTQRLIMDKDWRYLIEDMTDFAALEVRMAAVAHDDKCLWCIENDPAQCPFKERYW